jgi:hypothetical protein
MRTALYITWGAVGIVMFNRLAHLQVPLWMYPLVVLWGFLCGGYFFVAGQEDKR